MFSISKRLNRSKVYTKLAGFLQCDNCFKRLNTPCKICKCGHVICDGCARLSCPVCFETIFYYLRHTLLNSLIETIKTEVDFLRQLTIVLECPVCYFQIFTPNEFPDFSLCGNGHGICNECAKKTGCCPLCRAPFLNITMVKFRIRRVAKALSSPLECGNECNGCASKKLYQKLPDHEFECRYCFYECQVGNCTWRGTEWNLINHGIMEHSERVLSGLRTKCYFIITALEDGTPFVELLKDKDEDYILMYCKTDKGLAIATQSKCTTELAKFNLTLTNEKGFKMVYTLPIIGPDDNLVKCVKKCKGCLLIPKNDIDYNCKAIPCSVEIKLPTATKLNKYFIALFVIFHTALWGAKIMRPYIMSTFCKKY